MIRTYSPYQQQKQTNTSLLLTVTTSKTTPPLDRSSLHVSVVSLSLSPSRLRYPGFPPHSPCHALPHTPRRAHHTLAKALYPRTEPSPPSPPIDIYLLFGRLVLPSHRPSSVITLPTKTSPTIKPTVAAALGMSPIRPNSREGEWYASSPLGSAGEGSSYGTFASPNADMATVTDIDNKADADHISDDGLKPTEPGHGPSISKLEPPPLVAAMSPEYRAEAEAKMRKKVDSRLLPMIILMYIMNYLDRNNIAAVRLAGLQDELNLSSVQYQTTVSILFVGYILMQIPSNLFLNKTGKPAIYLPVCMIVWGIISGATGACQNFGGLVACRFFLGFVEAAYFPGCLFYLSAWYTRKELGFRTAVLYSGSLVSGAFGGLVTAGITSNMDGTKGLRAWRWVFIIEGVITVVIAIGAFWILPNFPRTTSWLTEEERQLAVYRLQEDVGEDDWTSSESQTFFHGLKLALMDIKTWVLTILLLSIVSSASVTNFFPTVVKTLGYDNIKTLLLTAPPYVLAVITTYINAWHADRTGERFFHITLPLCVGVVAFILCAATHSTAPRYVAMMLMVPGVYTGYVVALAWISNSLPRPPAKRAAALAFINAVSNTSSIYASYMYPQPKGGQQPNLVVPLSVDCATAALAIIMTVIMRIILGKLNKKLDRGEHVEGAINAVPGVAQAHGFRFLV